MSKADKIKYYLESIAIQTAIRNEARRNGDTEEEAIAQGNLIGIINALRKER